MGTIIPLFIPKQQSRSELADWRRMTRLDRATSEEMRSGLGLLCVVDPVGFEVALPAARPDPDAEAELGEFEAGHEPEVMWYLPEELAEELPV